MLFYYLITLFLSNNLEAKTYTLNDLMNHIQKHPDVLENEFEISKAENQINKIKGEIGPKFSAIVGMGPNYSTTGNALSSVQSKSLNTKSYLAELDLKIPIFTFFRDRDYKNAAAINIEVKKIEKEQKIRELQRKAKEIYYSLQYAQTLNDYATDTQKDLESVLSDFAKSKKNNSEEHNKLKIFYNVVMAKKLEIEKGIKLSKLGIQYITNDFDQAIELDQSWLAFSEVTLPKLEDLILKIKDEHLDYKKVELGIKAYESLNSGEEKAKLPTFGIFAKYDWMNTDKSTTQNSKFANDPYNKKDASLGIGLIWDFDFGSKDYKINEAKIELNNLLTKKNF